MEATLHHAAIAVRDMEGALVFYRDLLGFTVDWDMNHRSGEALSRVVGLPQAEMRIVMLQGYGGRLELFQYHNPPGQECGPRRQCDFGLTHLALAVKGITDIYERLVAAGVRFNCPPQVLRPGVKATYMQDPEGVTIELVEYQA